MGRFTYWLRQLGQGPTTHHKNAQGRRDRVKSTTDSLDDILANDHLVALARGVVIGRTPHQHLVQQNADSPVVGAAIVAFA